MQIFSDASSRFGDLDRIEILKGPQGTLYGGSNIGGAVKFVSARPDSEDGFGRVKAVLGDQGVVDFEGSLNQPLGNDWGLRVFGFTASNDGYLTNPNSPRVNGMRNDNDPDVGASEESGYRVSLGGPVGEVLSVYTSIRWNRFEGPNNTWIRELDTSLAHPNVVDTSTNARHERKTRSAMLELTWELENVDLVSVSSNTRTYSDRYSDLDISQEWLLDLFRPEEMDVITQELRIASTGDGAVQWLGGVYYSRYDEMMDADLIWWGTEETPDGGFTGAAGVRGGTAYLFRRVGGRDHRLRDRDTQRPDAVRETQPREEPLRGIRQCNLRRRPVGDQRRSALRPVVEQHRELRHRVHRRGVRHADPAPGVGKLLSG